jgi:transmembrane sensor
MLQGFPFFIKLVFMPDRHIIQLIIKDLKGERQTDQAIAELDAWINLSPDNRRFYEDMQNKKGTISYFFLLKRAESRKDAARLRFDQNLQTLVKADKAGLDSKIKKIGFFKYPYLRVAAAAMAISLGTGLILYSNLKHQTVVIPNLAYKADDIAPGGNKAMLVLSNGRKIALEVAKNGSLASEGKTQILKLDSSKISYNIEPLSYRNNGKSEDLQYNSIITPRGGQYQVVLSDGSKVWLNAASSLRFPSSFSGKDRTVTLSGEGYFEIHRDTNHPFKVQVGKMVVQVMGTHFDVVAYPEESSVNTTLLEGSVRVTSDQNASSTVLIPGQQARVKVNGAINVITDEAPDKSIAWVNGLFIFKRDSIGPIMRQLSRWYDVQIEYQGRLTTTFSGEISRSNNASDVLEALKASRRVNFKIEGKKIIVLP